MQEQWEVGDRTEAGDPIILGTPRQSTWEAPETHAENIEIIEAFLEPIFGTGPTVFHEILSDKIHLDVLVYPPTDTRDDYIYVTCGMSDLPMALPEGVPPLEFARAELMLALPRDWGDRIAALETTTPEGDPDDVFWPVGAMKWLARYPHLARTFLAPGHSLDHGGAFSESTRFNGFMLTVSSLLPSDRELPVLSTGEVLNFYGVVYLYPEEMELKTKKGAEVLFDRLSAQGSPERLTLTRPSVVSKNPILRLLKGD
ncbi:suppressor of fused domain protein [Primorskyibacter sp. 2E107]|uniref:suppressor of fused domain protein n=1 Tax=Primorskyibacter sp. 2E107 TaxID=3403458 RepID=UPI003AF60C1B